MAKPKANTEKSGPTLSDAVAVNEKIEALEAQIASARETQQRLFLDVFRAAKAVEEEAVFTDTKTGETLGRGPRVSFSGIFGPTGARIDAFSRWNKGEGRPTIVVKGLTTNREDMPVLS